MANYSGRAPERQVQVGYRVSAQRRDELKARAQEKSVSVQALIDHLLFNDPLREDPPSGPRPKQQRQQELPMAG